MTDQWMFVTLNPEAWAVGPVGVMRQNGKLRPYIGRNQQLHAYKEAVKEELQQRYGSLMPTQAQVELFLYFWQRLDKYESSSGRKTQDRRADLTNLVKAFEDAIQGVLIKNDTQVKAQRSVIVAQNTELPVTGVLVRIKNWVKLDPSEIPDEVWMDFHEKNIAPLPESVPNDWSTEGIF